MHILCWKKRVPSGNVKITNWKITKLFMGKLTSSHLSGGHSQHGVAQNHGGHQLRQCRLDRSMEKMLGKWWENVGKPIGHYGG